MEGSPVSAFAVYKQNKNTNHNKQQQKKNRKQLQREASATVTVQPASKTFTEDLMKTAAKRLKNQHKREKDTKSIGKKKSHKKKKAKAGKGRGKALENKKVNNVKQTLVKAPSVHEESDHESIEDVDDIPTLIPAPKGDFEPQDIDSASQSSNNSFEFTPVQTNSVDEGIRVFNWMIAPYNPKDFYNQIWEKKPLFVSRNKPLYYKDVISTPMIDNMLRKENIQFTKNIDITSYVDGKRETHNPVGRAHPHVVWDYYLNGCSIRLLNPQTYLRKLHLMNATLQEFFNSFVGANAYLTPPDSQGFAPHYDDIEAFILQVEGKKKWRVYKPLSENEVLPRVSSKNFDQSEIGEPLLEVIVEAGDMLYFPRGYIHQGVTIDGEHSLHVTVSVYQKHSYADLFERMIPAALQLAINENVEFRKGLPFDLYDNFGLVNSDVVNDRKEETLATFRALCDKIKDYLPVDTAVDELAKKFQHDALPPVLTDLEKAVTVYGDSDVMIKNGKVVNRVEIGLDSRIRLLRRNILRMVMEEDGIRLYYSVENSLEYHAHEPQYLEIDESLAPAIETLLTSYPEYVFVENLDVASEADKLQVANDLWERGLVMTEYPLETIEDD
ncbi:ribosomal oxygenase 1 [Plutella xylostella]|uniref:ribosomal oxygenase 1 n=1 Tax=Plutella xylostella TaxID=51655 RepID=UPI002032420F|nr:ribosomal oxygenase 1 [Plutella xylostella]